MSGSRLQAGIHGRNHRRGGSDPIPFDALAYVPTAARFVRYTCNQDIAKNTNVPINFTSSAWITNDIDGTFQTGGGNLSGETFVVNTSVSTSDLTITRPGVYYIVFGPTLNTTSIVAQAYNCFFNTTGLNPPWPADGFAVIPLASAILVATQSYMVELLGGPVTGSWTVNQQSSANWTTGGNQSQFQLQIIRVTDWA